VPQRAIAGFIGKRFPTRFHFKGHAPGFELSRDAHLNSRVRITFETDAANDYFKRDEQPGEFELYLLTGGEIRPAINYQRPRLHNGQAHLSLSLPDDAKEGDTLRFETRTTDPSRIEPFRNVFTLSVKAERTTTKGGQGGRSGSGTEAGGDKGSKEGEGQTKDAYLDIPEPRHVYEKEWGNYDPAFDKFTAMRVIEPPDAKPGENRYDYYLNMDNVHLQSFLKVRPKHANGMKLRYSVGMTLVALSLLHQDQLRGKGGAGVDMPNDDVDVRDRVANVTCALAPFLLPMIESVSELDEDHEALSDSAGEAA
jgi:hypothetical protein